MLKVVSGPTAEAMPGSDALLGQTVGRPNCNGFTVAIMRPVGSVCSMEVEYKPRDER